ncbi:hypothetical protein KR074_004201 [Drosophila pseudoananassae]|nr:hypothetical protein KR074_004201 [Drosophila pseudoananassae]
MKKLIMFLFLHAIGYLCLAFGMAVPRLAVPPVATNSLLNNSDEVEQEQILMDNSNDNRATPPATMSAMDMEDMELDEMTPATPLSDFQQTSEAETSTMSAMDMEDMELDGMTPSSTPSDFQQTSETETEGETEAETETETGAETETEAEAQTEKPVRLSKRIRFHKLEKVVHITPESPLMSQLQPPRNWEKSWSDFLTRSEALRHTRKFVIDLQKDEEGNEQWE